MVGAWYMKKKILIFLTTFYFLVVGYTYPDGSPYVIVNCSLGSNTTMYIPRDTIEKLVFTDSSIINSSANTVYCYIGDYKIYFPTYDEPYYYTGSGYSSNTNYLSITSVVETHFDDSGKYDFVQNSDLVTVCLLGGCLLCLLMLTTHRS